jgi:hypothetical protein
MLTRQKNLLTFYILVAIVMIFAFNACGSRAPYVGKYIADNENGQEKQPSFILLKEQGQGVWRIADNEISFSWNVKGKKIRLHVKPSGVVVGNIKQDQIEITLPGSHIMVFKKENRSR